MFADDEVVVTKDEVNGKYMVRQLMEKYAVYGHHKLYLKIGSVTIINKEVKKIINSLEFGF